jgi:hypothetical protein
VTTLPPKKINGTLGSSDKGVKTPSKGNSVSLITGAVYSNSQLLGMSGNNSVIKLG